MPIHTPGVYNLTDAEYRADPVEGGSLSASGAQLLIKCPAKFNYRQTAGEERQDYFDFGKAAHAHVLGVGAPIRVIDADDWRTKAAKEERDAAYADFETPVLRKDWERVEQMADALRQHPLAAALLDPKRGTPEQTIVWHDRIWRRALIDWLPDLETDSRLIITDYKTTADASADAFAKSAANYGYHQQDAWYTAGVKAITGRDDVAFVFVVQEKEPPFLVNVVELTDSARRIGAWRNEIAVDRYIRGRDTGQWPGYGQEVEQVALPRWAEIEHEELVEMHREGAFQ